MAQETIEHWEHFSQLCMKLLIKGQLTLRKQKYLEQFFDFERRKFQRQKILNALKYVLKNRNKRERIAVYLYFKKYREVAKIVNFIKLMPPSHTTSQTEGLR